MRKVETVRFGEIEVDEDKILHFEHGIPAFEDEHEFVIIPLEDKSPYMFMQSLQTPELAFLVTIPFLFFPDYEFNLDDAIVEQLSVKEHDDLQIYVIITIPLNNMKKMTVNLLAPIVVNKNNLKARQVVLDRSSYKTKHRLFPDTDQEGEK